MGPEQSKKSGEEQENAPIEYQALHSHAYDEYEYFSDANDHWL